MATTTTTTTDVDDDDDDSHSSIQIVSTDVVNISFLQSCWLQNEVLHHSVLIAVDYICVQYTL